MGPRSARAHILGLRNYIDNYLAGAPDDDLIFLMDGMDVWLQQSAETLVRRYEELQLDVVVGADRKCWPNGWNSVGQMAYPVHS